MGYGDKEETGRIESTMLGYEDHGILSFMLDINFGGSGQGFGGHALAGEFTDTCVRGILKAVGVERWEQLKGRVVVARRGSSGLIEEIEAPAFEKHEGAFNVKKMSERFAKHKGG
jgi:hypothetical protein